MPIQIVSFTLPRIPAVKDFNARLREGGAPEEYVFFETPQPKWLPKGGNEAIFNELFLAVEGAVNEEATDGEAVRGAYALKRQPFLVRGEVKPTGYLHHPFSEGVVNKKYSLVGALLLGDALRREPFTYCLGMGGYDRPLPRMLIAMKWKHFAVPFRLRVLQPFRFLRGMKTLRRTAIRARTLDAAAFSGLGPLAIRALQAWKERHAMFSSVPIAVTQETSFGAWADDFWERCAPEYPLIAVRNRTTLNVLFPVENLRFTRLRISRGNGDTLGWAVVSLRPAEAHPQYGWLRVGQIVDVLAKPEDAGHVVRAALQALQSQGADVAVCNHSHADWVAALDRAGFVEGPSNFIFAAAPRLARALEPFDDHAQKLFFTRADGDGLYQFL